MKTCSPVSLSSESFEFLFSDFEMVGDITLIHAACFDYISFAVIFRTLANFKSAPENFLFIESRIVRHGSL